MCVGGSVNVCTCVLMCVCVRGKVCMKGAEVRLLCVRGSEVK